MDKDSHLSRFYLDTAGLLDFEPLVKAEEYRHHGGENTLMAHLIRTAWCAYWICRIFHVSEEHEEAAVQAALLHDLFGYDWHERPDSKRLVPNMEGIRHALFHGTEAADYVGERVQITERQRDAIRSHMFPLYPIPPRFCEGWVLTAADKLIAIKELFREFASKFGYKPKQSFILRALVASQAA